MKHKRLLLLGIPLLAVLGVTASEGWLSRDQQPAMLAVALPDPGFGPADYPAQLKAADNQLLLTRERVANGPGEWLRQESLARALMARFGLTASPDELAEANAVLTKARQLAPEGSGPLLTSAELAMTMHDLDAAEGYLTQLEKVAVSPEPSVRSEMFGLRGDIAFYHGKMDEARRNYEQADALTPSASNAIRRAILLRGEGRFDEAIATVGEAARRDSTHTPRGMANYAMQLGMIESARGNYPKASEWFGRADELFPGSWLTALYLAEAAGVAGNTERAIASFERVARETGDPQAMDAAAFLYLDRGNEQRSHEWSQRASGIWRDRVDQNSKAYMAHAFENELAFGDPQVALKQAETNAASRPYGDALILVAEALLATGQPAAARERLLTAERTGWRSAPLYARLSEAEEAVGNDRAAKAAAKKAREYNPRIFEPHLNRLWFGHG